MSKSIFVEMALAHTIGNAVEATYRFRNPDKEGTARMRPMLSKLGKSSYEMAVKIISDVGSATAKKMLGI